MATQTLEIYHAPGAGSLTLNPIPYGDTSGIGAVTLTEVGSTGIYRGSFTGTADGPHSGGLYSGSDFQFVHFHFLLRNATATFRGRTFPFETVPEPTEPPAWGDAAEKMLAWLAALGMNPQTQSASEFRLRDSTDTSTLGSRTTADNGTTLTVGGMT